MDAEQDGSGFENAAWREKERNDYEAFRVPRKRTTSTIFARLYL